MTQPVSHGYPDYARVISRAAKLFVDDSNTALNASVTRGPFFVGDIPYLAYVLDVFDTTANFWAEYYLEENLSTFLGDQMLSVAVDGGFDISLPVQGPWVLFRITPVSATGTFEFKVYEVGGPLSNLRGSDDNNIMITMNQTINAGLSASIDSFRTWPGQAQWFVDTGATSFRAELSSVDASGTVTIIDMIRSATAGAEGRQVFLPATRMRLTAINSSAANISFRGGLTARPVEPGR